jgi:predicted nucleic acid-binding Zn ribbon protein
VRRPAPRSLSTALEGLTSAIAPATTLARVQEVWERATGPSIAAVARPVAEHGGVLTVSCQAAVWAQELDLMAGVLVPRLNDALGVEAIRELRCRTG